MYAQVNGVTLYYEVCGEGPPILLLHGNGEDHTIFDKLAEQLRASHTVYCIDSRGHGRSSKVQELHYADMAEDIAALIRQLGLHAPILYGFSDGGIVGLLLAIRYPALLRKLIVSGANTDPTGAGAFWLLVGRLAYFVTRSKTVKLMVTEPHIAPEQLARICIPVLVLAGEKDMIREAHTRRLANSIPNSTLRILPGETHGSYVVHSPKLYEALRDFL